MLTRDDVETIALAKGLLDWSPKKNWVEQEGGLPRDIDKLAYDLVQKGMSRARAIATAISRAKYWATTSKNAKTRAKWAKAVAQWEKMKASAHVRMTTSQDSEVLVLSASSYDMDIVTKAFNDAMRRYSQMFMLQNPGVSESAIPSMRILELWNDCIIASDNSGKLYKSTFVVIGGKDVVFGDPVEVKKTYVPYDELGEDEEPEDDMEEMDSEDMPMQMSKTPKLDKVLGLTKETPLSRIMRL